MTFALTRIDASFQPHGSDKFVPLGRVDNVSITDTISDGKSSLVISYDPSNPASMKAATEQLGAGVIELVEGKDYTVDREHGIIDTCPVRERPGPVEQTRNKIAAAEAKRARRNAKRAREAAKVGG